MSYKYSFTLSIAFILYALTGCNSETSSSTEISIIKLEKFETIISIEDNVLATPTLIRFGSNSNLFVNDDARTKVLEVDSNGNIVNEFGQPGRGPGELLLVNNFFLTDNHLYIVDYLQYFIHKYDYNGQFISSMDYGNKLGLPNAPPAPFSASQILVKDITNQPFITQDGNVMLSAVKFSDSVQSIYELTDWDGYHIIDIGSVPEGSTFVIDNDKLRSDVSNRVVPSLYRSNAFVIHNRANSDEYFLIYSALPKISKYNSSGQKLWSTEIPQTMELDSLTTRFFETMDQLQQRGRTSRIDLKYYTSGVSNTDGELFLITNTVPVWIHHFSTQGELIHRYKLISEDIENMPIFDIDFDRQRIFVVTEEGDIRAYPF
ncbi:MAG: 6-bladed beta-propeller [Balneolaceae bacterium]|nr:MAG: 6-bladed beta-propeller [Balneolaceae bacterium]